MGEEEKEEVEEERRKKRGEEEEEKEEEEEEEEGRRKRSGFPVLPVKLSMVSGTCWLPRGPALYRTPLSELSGVQGTPYHTVWCVTNG